MSDEYAEALALIEELHPYWQKFEWYKLRDTDPVFYRELLEYSETLNNDRSEKSKRDSV